MEKEAQLGVKVITSKKIRIYPKNEKLWFDTLNLYRRAYNLTIEFMSKGRKPHLDFRRQIYDWCESECEEHDIKFNSNLVQDAYRKACNTRKSIIKKRMKGEKASYSFMSRNSSKQYFISHKLSSKKQIFPKLLGDCYWTESPPDCAVGKTVVVTYSNGEWYASVRYDQTICTPKTEDLKVVSLDQGVRKFITSFSETESVFYGKNFVKDKLVPLMTRLYKALSIRDKLKQLDKSKQIVRDRLVWINKKINRIRVRQQNLINDLHKRVAYDLVKNNDVILMPTFETKQMTQKSNEDKKRFLRRKTVRGMLSLAHYKFKLTLKWMAKKYGKTVIDVNESYTSKTMPDGSINPKLNGKATISFNNMIVDRDINGARNIFIRFFTKAIDSLSLQETYSLNLNHSTLVSGFCVLK